MPNGKWFITQFWRYAPPGGFGTIITTDDACHLWLRWSNNSPQTHRTARVFRGLNLMDDIYFCFTGYQDVEQQEAGDTLTHTFVVTPWVACQTRWYYFHGQVAGVNSPSTSPIFTFHMPVFPTPVKFEYYEENGWYRGSIWANVWQAQSFTPQEQHIIASLLLLMSRSPGTWPTLYIDIYRAVDDEPVGDPVSSGEISFTLITEAFSGGWSRIPLSEFHIEPNTKYVIVAHTNATSVSRCFWHRDRDTGAYPRGIALTSSSAGAIWTKWPLDDCLFQDWGYPFFP